jgi:tetratricopeptide (TPR) repeat protein
LWFSWPERGLGPVDDTPLLTARAIAEELGDDDLVARTSFLLGHSLLEQGRFDEGRAMLLAAGEHYARRGMRTARGWYEQALGWGHMLRGDLARAAGWFERTLEGLDDRFVALLAWSGLAMVAALTGDTEAARQHLERILTTARDLSMRRFLVMGLCRATEIGLLADDEPMAMKALDELLATLRETGALRWVAGALEATVALLRPGSAEDAATLTRLLGAAEGTRAKLGDAALPAMADRLDQRRQEIASFIDPEQFATETDRGRAASSDEALRWALSALRTSPARCPAST